MHSQHALHTRLRLAAQLEIFKDEVCALPSPEETVDHKSLKPITIDVSINQRLNRVTATEIMHLPLCRVSNSCESSTAFVSKLPVQSFIKVWTSLCCGSLAARMLCISHLCTSIVPAIAGMTNGHRGIKVPLQGPGTSLSSSMSAVAKGTTSGHIEFMVRYLKVLHCQTFSPLQPTRRSEATLR